MKNDLKHNIDEMRNDSQSGMAYENASDIKRQAHLSMKEL